MITGGLTSNRIQDTLNQISILGQLVGKPLSPPTKLEAMLNEQEWRAKYGNTNPTYWPPTDLINAWNSQ